MPSTPSPGSLGITALVQSERTDTNTSVAALTLLKEQSCFQQCAWTLAWPGIQFLSLSGWVSV